MNQQDGQRTTQPSIRIANTARYKKKPITKGPSQFKKENLKMKYRQIIRQLQDQSNQMRENLKISARVIAKSIAQMQQLMQTSNSLSRQKTQLSIQLNRQQLKIEELLLNNQYLVNSIVNFEKELNEKKGDLQISISTIINNQRQITWMHSQMQDLKKQANQVIDDHKNRILTLQIELNSEVKAIKSQKQLNLNITRKLQQTKRQIEILSQNKSHLMHMIEQMNQQARNSYIDFQGKINALKQDKQRLLADKRTANEQNQRINMLFLQLSHQYGEKSLQFEDKILQQKKKNEQQLNIISQTYERKIQDVKRKELAKIEKIMALSSQMQGLKREFQYQKQQLLSTKRTLQSTKAELIQSQTQGTLANQVLGQVNNELVNKNKQILTIIQEKDAKIRQIRVLNSQKESITIKKRQLQLRLSQIQAQKNKTDRKLQQIQYKIDNAKRQQQVQKAIIDQQNTKISELKGIIQTNEKKIQEFNRQNQEKIFQIFSLKKQMNKKEQGYNQAQSSLNKVIQQHKSEINLLKKLNDGYELDIKQMDKQKSRSQQKEAQSIQSLELLQKNANILQEQANKLRQMLLQKQKQQISNSIKIQQLTQEKSDLESQIRQKQTIIASYIQKLAQKSQQTSLIRQEIARLSKQKGQIIKAMQQNRLITQEKDLLLRKMQGQVLQMQKKYADKVHQNETLNSRLIKSDQQKMQALKNYKTQLAAYNSLVDRYNGLKREFSGKEIQNKQLKQNIAKSKQAIINSIIRIKELQQESRAADKLYQQQVRAYQNSNKSLQLIKIQNEKLTKQKAQIMANIQQLNQMHANQLDKRKSEHYQLISNIQSMSKQYLKMKENYELELRSIRQTLDLTSNKLKQQINQIQRDKVAKQLTITQLKQKINNFPTILHRQIEQTTKKYQDIIDNLTQNYQKNLMQPHVSSSNIMDEQFVDERKPHTSVFLYGNAYIEVNNANDEVWIGTKMIKGGQSFYTKNSVVLHKKDMKNITKSYHQSKDLPIKVKIITKISSKVCLIRDIYKGKQYFGLRMFNYYDKQFQLTKNGFNLTPPEMRELIDYLQSNFK